VFEATSGESKEKSVYFLNWNNILWVEPGELDESTSFPDGIASESDLQ
jgi:hypothetical protein